VPPTWHYPPESDRNHQQKTPQASPITRQNTPNVDATHITTPNLINLIKTTIDNSTLDDREVVAVTEKKECNIIEKPSLFGPMYRIIRDRIFGPSYCPDFNLTGGGVHYDEDTVPTRVVDLDLQKVTISKFYRMKIVRLKNENLYTFLTCQTPDFKSEGFIGGYYFYELDEEVDLPQDYVTHASGFWNARDLNESNYRIWVKQTEKWATTTTLQGLYYKNLCRHGPAITMYYDYADHWKNDAINRNLRGKMKIEQFWWRFKLLKTAMLWLMTILVLLNWLMVFTSNDTHKMVLKEVQIGSTETFCSDFMEFDYSGGCNQHRFDCYWNPDKYNNQGNYYNALKLCDSFAETNLDQNSYFRQVVSIVLTNKEIVMKIFDYKVYMLIAVLILHPLRLVFSPIVEEADRGFKSTIIIIILEYYYYGSFVTAPFHMLMLMLTLFGLSRGKRTFIHIVYNCYSTLYTSQPASSLGYMLGKSLISNKTIRKNNIKAWEVFKSKPMIDYVSRVLNPEIRKGGKIKLMYEAKPKQQKYQYNVGLINECYMPIAFASNQKNEIAAIKERILKPTPEPDEELYKEFFRWVKSNYKKIFPVTSSSTIVPLPFKEYIENSNASPSVKIRLKMAHCLLKASGTNETTKLSRKEIRKYCKRKTFVKVENLLYQTYIGLKDKTPRPIQGAPEEFICLVGPWIASLQKLIKQDWHHNNFICFTSGVDSKKAAKLITKFDMWLEDDVSAWDASNCEELLEIEYWLFLKFGAPLATAQLMQENINTRGQSANGVKYKRKGCRKSGDPYTSLGNSMMNALIHLYIYCKENNCSINQARVQIRMLVQGDDNLINLSIKSKRINWKAWMLRFGFKAIAIYRTNRDRVEFCSMRLYNVKEGVVFGPIPGKVLAKLGVFCDPKLTENPLTMIRGTALGLVKGCYHIPPIRIVIDRILELTKHIGQCNVESPQPWQMKFKPCTTILETWSCLNSVYSWDQWFNSAMESEYLRATLGSHQLGPISEYIMDRDTSGPKLLLW